MKAVVFEAFGGPEVLQLADLASPVAGPGEVRITVRAAGVNPLDWKIRSGMMPFLVEFPAQSGLEAAGVVDQVGEGVEGVQLGDEVFGLARSAYAEQAVLTAWESKPAGMSWEVASVLPVAIETAVRTQGLLGLAPGQTIVIHGAAGAVGTVAIQLAVRAGVTVIGTASPGNHEFVRSLGATPVAYGDGLAERVRAVAPDGVDLAFDYAGHGALPDLIALTGSPAAVITIADMAAQGLGVRFTGGGPEQRPDALATGAALFAEGALVVRTGPSFSLAEAGAAQAASFEGKTGGKPVLVP